MNYNRFRYYDNDVGMFISRDPIELAGGFNVFAYAPNPVQWVDPLGLWFWQNDPKPMGTDIVLFDKTTDANFISINKKIPSLSNTFQIFGHGNSQFIRDVVNGKKVTTKKGMINSAKVFDARFKSNSEWQLAKASKSYKLALYACTTGHSTLKKDSLAEKISRAYPNLTVIAPTRQTWWNSQTGFTGVYAKKPDKTKDFNNPGYWMVYQGGKAVKAYDATWQPGDST